MSSRTTRAKTLTISSSRRLIQEKGVSFGLALLGSHLRLTIVGQLKEGGDAMQKADGE